jgi:hypothetical protein
VVLWFLPLDQPAWALDCASAPGDFRAEEAVQLRGWAHSLVRASETDFGAVRDRALIGFRRAHPDADDLIAELSLLHAACSGLAEDRELSEAEKREAVITLEQRLTAPRSGSPRSFSAAPHGTPRHPQAALHDDVFTELTLALRTAGAGRRASDLAVSVLIEGGTVATQRTWVERAERGDLEIVSFRLDRPIPVELCRDLSLEVRLSDADEGWNFNLVSAAFRTGGGQTLFNLFAPVGAVQLNSRNQSKYFDLHHDGCPTSG